MIETIFYSKKDIFKTFNHKKSHLILQNHKWFGDQGCKNLFTLGSQKRTSKSKKNIRKSAWKKKIEKQATKSLFLAKYLIQNKPEDPAVEKLVTRIRDEKEQKVDPSVE